ncbi:MAG: hypothetical protein Q8S73_45090 [Deltaproteobacteria bacterium]|nr:hypothetical protein [Myxococcales bacterium]MDP3221344.1 hypothetical protein [Deltaproteobacteria bacterium]
MATQMRSPSWKELSLVAFGAAVAGSIAAAFLNPWAGVAIPVSALCSFAVLWSTTTRVRSELATDPRRALASALGASAAVLFVGTWIVVFHLSPRWVESTYLSRDHSEPPAALMLPSIVSMLGLPLLIALIEAAAFRLHRPLRVAVRGLVAPLAVAVAALAVAGLARGACRPTPRSPVDLMPIVATLRTPAAAGVTERHPLGPLTLSVTCVQSYSVRCHVMLQRDPVASLPVGWPFGEREIRIGTREESTAAADATLRVRHDTRHDLWIVEAGLQADRPLAFHAHPIAAFRGYDLDRVNLDVRDFPGDFSPPPGWSIAALLGVALAGWFVRRARLVAPLPDVPLLDALAIDGTLHLPDGTTLAASTATPARFGSMVVAAPPAGPYRDATPASVLRIGTIAQWREALDHDGDVRSALAFSTLLLLGTPMLLAAYLRLLW